MRPCRGVPVTLTHAALLALVLAAPDAGPGEAAQPAPSRLSGGARDRPVDMRARGGLRVDLKKQTGVAEGDVVIQRDDVTVCCDRAEALFSKNSIQRVECRGNVVVLRPDGTRARADVAVFDASADTVTLAGKAHVQSLEADLQGESIVYDIASDRLEVRGKKARVRYTPQPEPPLALGRTCPPPPEP